MLIAGFAPWSRRIFHVLPTLLANVVFGRILNRPSPRGPLFVTWLLTFDCNAFCGFCGTHSLKKIFPEKMPIERALEIADEIADAGTWAVGFTGGEVFLSPLLFPLVERLKSRGVVVYIVTNGMGLTKYAQRLVELEVDVIQVSLDFADAELHDRNRKVGGLYEGALAGLREIKRLRKKRKPIIKTNTVVMKENIDDIDIEELRNSAAPSAPSSAADAPVIDSAAIGADLRAFAFALSSAIKLDARAIGFVR